MWCGDCTHILPFFLHVSISSVCTDQAGQMSLGRSIDTPCHTLFHYVHIWGMHASTPTHTHIHTVTLANSCCGFPVIAENQNKDSPTECMQIHTRKIQLSPSYSFPALESVREIAHRANVVICFYRFINIFRHAPTNTQTLLPPPLIFFPSTKFQSPFCFLCNCSSLPSPPFASLTPTKFHSWR